MNILSTFDGISCGQIALNRCGIEYDKYFASEINKQVIAVTQHNYPNTIQIGDICDVKSNSLPGIDLLMGGFCCQSFSHPGKQLNFDDPRGKLFFQLARLKNELQPKWFLFENVVMKKQWQNVISQHCGVEPYLIDSQLFSAQERKRLYWTNIPFLPLPQDKGINFADIAGQEWYAGAMRGRRIDPIKGTRDDYNLSIKSEQYIECRQDNKSNCLTTVCKDNVATKIKVKRKLASECEYRWLTPNEYEALQTIPKDYTACVSDNQRRIMLGNAWTVDVICHILQGIKG